MTRHIGLARFTWRAVKALALTAIPVAMLVQTMLVQNAAAQNPAMAKADPNKSSDMDKRPFDKRDFSGLWARNPQTYQLPACPECRDQALAPGYGFYGDFPPRTPAGEKKFQLNKPSRGYELNSKEANAHPE